jgi:8-oxo-dGTP pyrophosphatase MutT (NUDIX family)
MERINHIRNALNNHPVRIIEPGGRAHASVALILEEQPSGLSILLIERSTSTNDYWSGQIGLPGGRSEPIDKSPQHTAERETREEIGLDLSTTLFLGRLDDIAPGGLKIVVSCFVYAVNDHPVLCPDKSEIADAFWVPARELNNPARISSVEFIFRNRLRRFPALRVADDKKQPLWGITYNLLRNFYKVVHNVPKQDRRNSMGAHNNMHTKSKRTGTCRSWLVEFLPHIFLCKLLRPKTYGLQRVAGYHEPK